METNLAAKEEITDHMLNQQGDCFDLGTDIAEIIHEGFKRLESRDYKEFIEAANKAIVEAHGTNIDITGNLGDIHVTEMKGAYINNVERLKVVLGKHFKTLVTDDEIATQDLIDIACDADDPRAPEVRGCITIKKIINVSWHLNIR